ncbi:hypothetical protein [Ancylobacter sp. IITR112]|uniref:hypothetical protein n=1 Tax=Ancylobacter sp. IITR112 TaxID=3138073 RepID=UPI003529F1B7
MMQNFFVLTPAQRVESMAFNTPDVAIDPRAVDNPTPGVGLNLNDNASDYEPGDPVTLVGKFVAPKAIVDDPEYATYAPGMIAYLLTLPWCTLETETIFAPTVIPGW